MGIKKYFMNREQWGIETERLITREVERQEYNWSLIMEQRVIRAKDKILIEKNSEINELEDTIKLLKTEIHKLRKVDIEVEKLKNELRTMIITLDSQTNRWLEVESRIGIQLGMDHSLVKRAEKLLKKDVG